MAAKKKTKKKKRSADYLAHTPENHAYVNEVLHVAGHISFNRIKAKKVKLKDGMHDHFVDCIVRAIEDINRD